MHSQTNSIDSQHKNKYAFHFREFTKQQYLTNSAYLQFKQDNLKNKRIQILLLLFDSKIVFKDKQWDQDQILNNLSILLIIYLMDLMMEQIDPFNAQTNPKKQKNKKKKKEKKVKYEKLLESYPSSIYSCPTHQNQYLRLFKQDQNDKPSLPTCKSCGIVLNGLSGYLTCSKLKNCYHLCSACKVCYGNHPLFKAAKLSHYDEENQLYNKNKFKCHKCKQQQEVGQKGVYHCRPCNFSICVQCMDKNMELWDDKNND